MWGTHRRCKVYWVNNAVSGALPPVVIPRSSLEDDAAIGASIKETAVPSTTLEMATAVPALSALLKKATIVDHHEVLNAANAEVQRSKGDVEAQHAKAVALLQLDRYDEAVQLFEGAGNALKKRAKLEHAYALYKSGNLEQAQVIAQGIDENRGAQHLNAQIVRFVVT